jgi:CheY-like chemotaxis protein
MRPASDDGAVVGPSSAPPGAHQQVRILIAEDDLILREVLTEWVRKLGYEAVPVQNGRAALAAVAAQPPDLVLLDIGMPGLNGFEVCRRLKADPTTRGIRVLFITGIGEKYRRAGIQAGAEGFLNKPFTLEELQARIQALLGPRGPTAADPETP